MGRNILNLLKVCVFFLFLISFSYSQNFESESKISMPEYVPGEVIVKYKTETTKEMAQALSISSLGQGVEIKSMIKPKDERPIFLMKLPGGVKVEDAISQLKNDPNVEYAEPNYIYKLLSTYPNDPSFNLQWYLENTGQNVNGFTGTPGADIKAPQAWDITTGSPNVVIAVIDSGMDMTHPDLEPNLYWNLREAYGTDGVDDDNNGYIDDKYGWDFIDNDNLPYDFYGHGTHVAGIIGAKGNNNQFITGVNWNVKIMPLRCGGVSGHVKVEDGFVTSYGTAAAIRYATNNGAHIINASYGGPVKFSQTQYDAWKYASDRNVLCVISAGNEKNDNDTIYTYPADYGYAPACNGNPALPNIISVAATDENDNLASYSNYGRNSVHVAAPGGEWYDVNNNGKPEYDKETNLLSTYPEIIPNALTLIYSQNFEGDFSELEQGGTPLWWTVVLGDGVGGTKCLEDSPGGNYPNNADTWVGIKYPFERKKERMLGMSFYVKGALEENYDFFRVEFSPDKANWDGLKTSILPPSFTRCILDLTPLYDLLPQFYLRFRLTSDETINYDGVYIDDVTLFETPLSIDTHTETYLCGTSMAAPVVSGIAGLIKSVRPWADASMIKNIILSSVDKLPSLSDKVITGGRVNAYKAVTYNTAPNRPSNTSPSNGQTGISLTPTLTASSYSDPEGDGHSASQWQITTVQGDYSSPIWDSGETTPTTSISILPNILTYSTTYYWRVRYKDNYIGGSKWSNWSTETSFTTQEEPSGGGGGGGGGGCFIASVCFGESSWQVKIFKNFRDRYLVKHKLGEKFIGLYYKYSPSVADFLRSHRYLIPPVKAILYFVLVSISLFKYWAYLLLILATPLLMKKLITLIKLGKI